MFNVSFCRNNVVLALCTTLAFGALGYRAEAGAKQKPEKCQANRTVGNWEDSPGAGGNCWGISKIETEFNNRGASAMHPASRRDGMPTLEHNLRMFLNGNPKARINGFHSLGELSNKYPELMKNLAREFQDNLGEDRKDATHRPINNAAESKWNQNNLVPNLKAGTAQQLAIQSANGKDNHAVSATGMQTLKNGKVALTVNDSNTRKPETLIMDTKNGKVLNTGQSQTWKEPIRTCSGRLDGMGTRISEDNRYCPYIFSGKSPGRGLAEEPTPRASGRH